MSGDGLAADATGSHLLRHRRRRVRRQPAERLGRQLHEDDARPGPSPTTSRRSTRTPLELGEPRPRLRRRAAPPRPAGRAPARDGERGQGRDDLPRRPRQHGPLQHDDEQRSSRRCRTSSPNGQQPEPGNYSAPVYFNGYVFFVPDGDNLQAFKLTNGLLVDERDDAVRRRSSPTAARRCRGSANGTSERDPLGRAAERARLPASSTRTTRELEQRDAQRALRQLSGRLARHARRGGEVQRARSSRTARSTSPARRS